MSAVWNLSKICGRVYEVREKFHLFPYANWNLFWTNVAENKIAREILMHHITNFNNICKVVGRIGLPGEFRLWPFVTQALLYS
jgi:hypothetical protein